MCSNQPNYTSPWNWTTVTATGEWHSMARKEPDASPYLPMNNDFHNFHQLMNGTGAGHAAAATATGSGNKNRLNQNANHLNGAPKQLPISSGHNSTVMGQSPMTATSTSMSNTSIASGMRSLSRPTPPTSQHNHQTSPNVNPMLSPRHLPFPYNFHNTGGYWAHSPCFVFIENWKNYTTSAMNERSEQIIHKII